MTDERIIELYFARDEGAIKATSDKYFSYCFKIANNILNNRSDSDECVNDTWLKTWESIPPQRPNIFSAFLAKVTRGIALNKLKYESAQKRNSEAKVALEELNECIAGKDSPENELEAKELGKAVNKFLSTVSDKERRIFIRRYFFVEDVSDIAGKYGLSEKNVYTVLSRTRKKLKDYLMKEGMINAG